MIKSQRFLGLLTLFLLCMSCGSDVVGPSDLSGGPWKLQKLEVNGSVISVSRPDSFTLDFKDGGQIGVKADCNVCGGAYSLADSTLKVNTLACTLAYCGDTSNDAAFLAILNAGGSVSVSGSELKIESSKGIARLTR